MYKFGKSMEDIIDIKKDFIFDNTSLLEDRKRVADIYQRQETRCNCIICNAELDKNQSFVSHDLKYYICPNCNHVNGEYIETESFTNEVYVNLDYGKTYRADDSGYWQKVKKIYTPKLNFLRETLTDKYISESEIIDIGAGSGHFVAAGIKDHLRIHGIEVSQQQVDYANHMIGENCITAIDQIELVNKIRDTKAKILTAFGVFEHLTNLHEVMQAISANTNIEYVYFSVPMFSVSVLLEIMNPGCFNRQLGGAHTHLFSNKSLEYIIEKYGFERIHSWRFGTDIMDFYRISLINNSDNNYLKQLISENMKKVADDLQLVLDKADISSEIHIIIKNNNFI